MLILALFRWETGLRVFAFFLAMGRLQTERSLATF
jgi:hypothetical protein